MKTNTAIRQDAIKKIVSMTAAKKALSAKIDNQYKILARQIISDFERSHGRSFKTPGELMDWIKKNRPELKAIYVGDSKNWDYSVGFSIIYAVNPDYGLAHRRPLVA